MASGKLPKGALPGAVTRLIAALSALGSAGQILRVNAAATGLEFVSDAPWDVILQDQKTSGTTGGASGAGTTQVRTLNTEVYDPSGYCTLASNEFTLQAGTWMIEWEAPGSYVGPHRSQLYNVTDAAIVAYGSTEYVEGSGGLVVISRSHGTAVVTIASAKAFSVRHTTTLATANGLGWPSSLATEIYSMVRIKRIA